MANAAKQRARLVRWTRAFVFMLLAGILVGGPILRQGFHVGPRWLPAWRMFSGISIGVYDIRFETERDGRRVRLDPFALLDIERHDKRGRPWLVKKIDTANSVGKRLCGVLGPEEPVYLVARRAVQKGWKADSDPADDLCAAARERAERTKKSRADRRAKKKRGVRPASSKAPTSTSFAVPGPNPSAKAEPVGGAQ